MLNWMVREILKRKNLDLPWLIEFLEASIKYMSIFLKSFFFLNYGNSNKHCFIIKLLMWRSTIITKIFNAFNFIVDEYYIEVETESFNHWDEMEWRDRVTL